MDAQGRVSLSFSAEKVQSQLEQLTLEEKISLLSGSGFATTVSVPRLDIPSLNASPPCSAPPFFFSYSRFLFFLSMNRLWLTYSYKAC